MRVLRALLAVVFLLAVVARPSISFGVPPDPAARGLDLYVHAASNAPPGGTIELVVEAFGFPVVTHAVPLAGATVEAGWDPESLGLDEGAKAPPTVTVTTDTGGRARIAVPVPTGPPADLSLLVGVRLGTHSRSQAIKIARSEASHVELHVADPRVVPGSTISAWVRVVDSAGAPMTSAPVTVALEEGGVARHRDRLVTDAGGMAMARVPIPRIDEPVWKWTLAAKVERSDGGAPASIDLVPREENPGTPVLDAEWDAPVSGVRPGERAKFSIRLLDATRGPVADHWVRYWIGQRGTAPPADEEAWKKQSTLAKTDGAGIVTGNIDTPTLVRHGGSAMGIVARSELEGHALEDHADVAVGSGTATMTVMPETAAVVPGIVQRLAINVTDERDQGVAGTFSVTGDGLSATVTTNQDGDGDVSWNVPAVVGASRNVGPCAGGVAAAITVKPVGTIPQLAGQRDAFIACVPVDRDAEGIVRVDPTFARPGERVRVTLTRPAGKTGKRTVSVVAKSEQHPQSIAVWLEGRDDGSAIGDVTMPNDAGAGTWTLSLAGPDGARAADVATTSLFVLPPVLPKLEVRRLGGRAAPGGKVEVEARLTDGHGRPLQGSISAIVVDEFGGGTANVSAIDTRTTLCAELGHYGSCDAMLERDPSTDAVRRTIVSRRSLSTSALRPINDPGAHVAEDLAKTFGEVLRSLEGAVFEAAVSPQTLLDVGRKQNGRWSFNPELLTLATEAMSEPPQTPGGEKLSLADLVAVDPQVTFDTVAHRITRLKLFRILAAVRTERMQRMLDPDEPVFKDPNALLRRLVRKGSLTEDALLDPWGGTLQFVRSNAPPVPFLSVARGWELHAPGPDGIVGTPDDVRDPFERVVRSGSPYAKAVDEDRLVDARFEMVVSEETVQSWQATLEDVTGTHLGQGQGIGLGGSGEGGGGHGSASPSIRQGATTMGRGTAGISTGDAYWVAPTRTDADGRVRLVVPLGDVETTWQVALVGVVDGGGPATASIDVPSDLPLSARVAAGAKWVEGDVVETEIIVRNRTNEPVRAKVVARAEGSTKTEGPTESRIDVPAHGARSAKVRVRATAVGEGALVVTTEADGIARDELRHTWDIVPAGELRVFTKTAWVDGEKQLALTLDYGHRVTGTPRVVLERGYDDAVAAALDSLEPERQTSTAGLVDAHEAAVRIERWATTKSTPRHRALAFIAHGMAERAAGRYWGFAELDSKTKRARIGPSDDVLEARMRDVAKTDCPVSNGTGTYEALDLEPPPAPDVLPCWGVYVSDATQIIENRRDPETLAVAILALAEKPHRAAITATLADELRSVTGLRANGDLQHATSLIARDARATVYAALLRAAPFGKSAATPDRLFSEIAVLRDVNGGYGSSRATLAVIRALLASQLEGHGTTRARVRSGGVDTSVVVPESGDVSVILPQNALDVVVETEGAGLVARFERPVLRSWSRPPPSPSSPIGVDVIWPAEVRAGGTGLLRFVLRHSLPDPVEIDVRAPLPPGVTLAEPTAGVAQLQGVLAVRRTVGTSGSIVEVPVRFMLGGQMTAPEAIARLTRSPASPAVAPSRAIVVRPR